MTARVICRSLYLRAEIFGGATIERCGPRRSRMIAPRIGNGKCFDESDDVRIEWPQRGCLRAAALAVAISPFFYLFHAARITRVIWVVERAGRLVNAAAWA